MNFLVHTHSGLRWLLLIILVITVLNAYSKWRNQKTYSLFDKLSALLTFILSHLQLSIGLILYFISNKVQFNSATMSNTQLRFYTVEHFLMMLIAIILITLGYKRAKKAEGAVKHRRIFIWYGIALLLILIAIPWPFRSELAANWF
jgi:multisubunit Na+/H+ antiporter MnhB subunit